jgi:hypothetical protein
MNRSLPRRLRNARPEFFLVTCDCLRIKKARPVSRQSHLVIDLSSCCDRVGIKVADFQLGFFKFQFARVKLGHRGSIPVDMGQM